MQFAWRSFHNYLQSVSHIINILLTSFARLIRYIYLVIYCLLNKNQVERGLFFGGGEVRWYLKGENSAGSFVKYQKDHRIGEILLRLFIWLPWPIHTLLFRSCCLCKSLVRAPDYLKRPVFTGGFCCDLSGDSCRDFKHDIAACKLLAIQSLRNRL